ncbi:hypothetical protein EZJ43_11470 [Pedobacter changchengzhani]|uniref:Beta/gamma crystallin 'Greek key' domain-containing protein n=1 Tax=Pedobacter changchengzhani TaxID=2529274 RepID=A0A4R5MJZ8_9SPHI|nr:hypothetical protein [Pedobacter changchengzhani]TDG35960.1 hypothetical protein EZJ43_11470 [Pedobacter changchengzhani]
MKNLKVIITSALIALATSSDAQVTIYKDCGYEGLSLKLPVGFYENLGNFNWNDVISSIKIEPGYEVTLYVDAGYDGMDFVFNRNHACLNDYSCNDQISSLIIRQIVPKNNAPSAGLSKEAIHAGQAFTTLIQESPYVAQNAGRLNGSPFYTTNKNPDFGNGYACGGTKNNAFFYNSLKQGADNRTAIWGPILDKWGTHNREHGNMDWPVNSVAPIKDNGVFAFFQNGGIYYKATTGAHVVWGTIRDAFIKAGSENGVLGYPKTDEIELFENTAFGPQKKQGVYQEYEGGNIYYKWEGGLPAFKVKGEILNQYIKNGGYKGKYGFPITEEKRVSKFSVTQVFAGGTLYKN